MKRIAIATTLGVALGTVAFVGAAYARNPHCAGGIQYVVQGMRDKDKGNTDDYKRQMLKAVQQLEQCAAEDSTDYEAMGYLGWAYAEIESCGPAGIAFRRAIAGLEHADKKKVDWATTNRNSYWATAFNNGITRITEAQAAYPDFMKPPAADADKTLKDEAQKKYQQAVTSLTCASFLKPGDPRTLRNLGSVYAFMGQWEPALAYFNEGIKSAPGDSDLAKSRRAVLQQIAAGFIDDKKYDKAVDFYRDLIKTDPSNSDLYLGVAEALFKEAQAGEGDARKKDFKAAGDAYARAGDLKPGDADLPFNAALAYQNAGENELAEGQWKAALKARPDDPDALSALGSTLADEKKFDESVSVLHQAVVHDPKNKAFHRQLGAAYTKAGNNPKGTEEYMVYLALTNGKPVDDPAAQAKKSPAGSDAAKTLASMSAPEQLSQWESDGQKYETWFYWTKMVAYHFNPAGKQVQKSDWSVAAVIKK